MRHRQLYTYMLLGSAIHGTAAAIASCLLLAVVLREFHWTYAAVAFGAGTFAVLLSAPRLVLAEAHAITEAMVRQLAIELARHYAVRGLPPDYDIAAISESALRAAREQLRGTKFRCLDPDYELRPDEPPASQ